MFSGMVSRVRIPVNTELKSSIFGFLANSFSGTVLSLVFEKQTVTLLSSGLCAKKSSSTSSSDVYAKAFRTDSSFAALWNRSAGTF